MKHKAFSNVQIQCESKPEDEMQGEDSKHHLTWREKGSDQATMSHRTGRSETGRYKMRGHWVVTPEASNALPYLSRSRSRWWCDAHRESTYWLRVTAATWPVGTDNLPPNVRTHAYTHNMPTVTIAHTNETDHDIQSYMYIDTIVGRIRDVKTSS